MSLYSPPAAPTAPAEPTASSHAPFPLDALPGFMRAIVEAGAAASNTPVSLTAPLALAAHSMAMGAGLELDCGGSLRCRGNLHMLGIAESGTGKSEAAKVMLGPVNELQRARLEKWEREDRPLHKANAAMLKQNEGKMLKDGNATTLAETIRDREAAELAASEQGRPLLYAGEATREALAAAISLSPGHAFAVINPDARGLLGIIAGKYSAGKASDEDIYLAGYSGDSMPSLRVTRGFVNLDSPCLTTCLLIQPDAFNDLRSKALFAESGWLQRNLLFDSHASFQPLPATPACVPGSVMTAWRVHLCGLIEHVRDAPSTSVVSPSPAAAAVMLERANAIRARIQSGELRDLASFACRRAEQANRIALNLHAAKFPGAAAAAAASLDEETIVNAWRIADWFAGEQMRLLSTMREDKRFARCTRLIEVLGRQGSQKQLPRWKLTGNGFDEEELLILAAAYPLRLQVGDTPSGANGGRPQQWIRAL